MSIYSDYANGRMHPYKLEKIMGILAYVEKNPYTNKTSCIESVYGKRSDYGYALLSKLKDDG